jgi:translation initiation factor 2D
MFPLPASSLYSQYVLPFRPASSSSDIDIKRSSFKKLTPWLKSLGKEGLLGIKEMKGDILVLSVNPNHAE